MLGASACFNQIAMTVVQIVMNNTLAHYGAQSVYGGDIPLACSGIITKVNMIFMSFVIGISQEHSRLSDLTTVLKIPPRKQYLPAGA